MTLLVCLALALQAPVDEEPFKLKNGLTVVLRPSAAADKVALVVLFSIGGDHDPEGKSGLAHLVEHLYVTAAAGETKARTAKEFFERYGGQANAQTGERYTVIAAVFDKEKLDEELRDAAARMSALVLDQELLDRERGRLVEEVANMFGGMPALGAANFGGEMVRPSPRGGRKGGQPDHVKTITVEDVRTHWKRYYKPRNAILSLAGRFDAAEARAAVAKHLEGLEAGEAAPEPGQPGAPTVAVLAEMELKSLIPDAKPQVALSFAAPLPDSDPYAPYLVAVMRFFRNGGKLGLKASESPVLVRPLDGPYQLAIVAPLNDGESGKEAVARLEAFVADALKEPLQESDRAGVRAELGMMLGFTRYSDVYYRVNPYAVAFGTARRLQMGVDSAKLGKALDELKEDDFRKAVEMFGPGKRAAVVLKPKF